jgi:hypothetical protein
MISIGEDVSMNKADFQLTRQTSAVKHLLF